MQSQKSTNSPWFPHGIEGQIGYLFGNGWSYFTPGSESYPKWIEDVRWVFWFDN